MTRLLATLPKAHLHLHFTGSMRHATLVELAGAHGVRLPPALTDDWPPRLSGADERGWFDAYQARVRETLAPHLDTTARAWLLAATIPPGRG